MQWCALNRSYSELYMIILATVMSLCIKDHASELHMISVTDVTQWSVVSDLKIFDTFHPNLSYVQY
jgi:hypothetical protein